MPRSRLTGAITVTVSPSTIQANGTSTATATATGFPPLTDTVTFTRSDGVPVGPTQANADGTYSATITSSTTVTAPGSPVQITASDPLGNSGTGALIQSGPGHSVSQVALNRPSIVANGASTTVATATVLDTAGNPVSGDSVTFTTPSQTVPGVDQGNGTYTATITSTTTPGQVTVTATESEGGSSNSAPLTQTSSSGSGSTLVLDPFTTSIRANGIDQTTATAHVTDALGLPVIGDNVVFVPSDPGDQVGTVTDHGNGTYSATITASTTAGTVQVHAVDLSSNPVLNVQQPLTQTPGASTTGLSVVPSQPVTNSIETIVATVAATSFGSPSGTVTVENGGTPIGACQSLPVTPASPAAECQVSFAAAGSPVALIAVFTPSRGNLAGSTSAVDSLRVGQDSTTTNIAPSSTNPLIGSTVTYIVAVAPAHGGSTQPSGSVQFTDGSKPLSGCSSVPVQHGSSSSGTVAAVCRVSFASAGNHVITAHYAGDGSFTGSSSSSLTTQVHKPAPPGRLRPQLAWQFSVGVGSTAPTMFYVSGVPAGATVRVKCHGRGCPYTKRTITVSNAKSCRPTTTLRCTRRTGNTVDLVAAFHHHRLRVGSQIRVEVLRTGFIGKYYLFTIRSLRAPNTTINCLAPGSNKPGKGC